MKKMSIGAWGRNLYGLIFIVFGVLHFVNLEGIAGSVPGFIPFGTLWAGVTGLIMLLAGLAILTKKYVRVMAIALAITLAVFVVLVQLPNLPGSMAMFLKDIGLFAGALMIINRYPRHDD